MADGGEILTFQFGPCSNYTGTHFWNIQHELVAIDQVNDETGDAEEDKVGLAEDEHDHGHAGVRRELRPELLHRVGRSSFSPRMILVDFKHTLGSFLSSQALMNSAAHNIFALSDEGLSAQAGATWDGPVDVRRQPQAPKNDFQKWLEESSLNPVGGIGATSTEAYMGDSGNSFGYGMYSNQVDEEGQGRVAQGEQHDETQIGGEDEEEEEEEEGLDADSAWVKRRVKESQIRSWSDYLKAKLLPQSLCLLHRYGDQDNSLFVSGQDALTTQVRDEIMDSVRFFLEESDRLQGAHVLVDVNNGFASIAQSVLEDFRDDFKRCSTLCIGLVEPIPENVPYDKRVQATARRGMNEAIAMARFTETCSLYVPMPLYSLDKTAGKNPYFDKSRFNATSLFQTTSLAAIGLDSLSLPYRRSRPVHGPYSAVTLPELVGRLAPTDDSRLAGLSMSMPFPFPEISSADLAKMLASWPALHAKTAPLQMSFLDSASPLLPKYGQNVFSTFGGSLVLRGVLPCGKGSMSGLESSLETYAEQTPTRLSPVLMHAAVRTPMPITLASPDYWNNSLLGSRGELSLSQLDDNAPPVSTPVVSYLESSTRLGGSVLAAHDTIARSSLSRRFDFTKGNGGLSDEDFDHMALQLSNMVNMYCDGLQMPPSRSNYDEH